MQNGNDQNNQDTLNLSDKSSGGQGSVISQNIPSSSHNDPPPTNQPQSGLSNPKPASPGNQSGAPTPPNPSVATTNQNIPMQAGGFQSYMGQAPTDETEVNVPKGLSKRSAGGKFVPTILGIILLVGAVGAGVYLAQQDTEVREKAQTIICVESENCIILENPADTGSYQVDGIIYSVFLTDDQVRTFDYTVTEDGCYQVIIEEDTVNWEKIGPSEDCNEIVNIQLWMTELPGPSGPPVNSLCLNLKIYDSDWEQITQEELNNLMAGDVVRFAVSANTSEGAINQARFIVNGVPRNPVSNIRADTDEFVDEYIVPEGIANFDIEVQLNHSEFGWF